MSEVLKPCPFCGGEASDWGVETYSLDSSYEMFGCEACGIGFDTGRDAENITAWNTRAAPKVRLPDAAKALLGCDELGGRKVVYDACERRVKVHKFDAVLREILSALDTGEAS